MKFVNGECLQHGRAAALRGSGRLGLPQQHRLLLQQHPHTSAEGRREEPVTSYLLRLLPALPFFFHAKVSGEGDPVAALTPLSLFQPSFFALTVGRRTDKGVRVA